jgi:hypothetical protein
MNPTYGPTAKQLNRVRISWTVPTERLDPAGWHEEGQHDRKARRPRYCGCKIVANQTAYNAGYAGQELIQ